MKIQIFTLNLPITIWRLGCTIFMVPSIYWKLSTIIKPLNRQADKFIGQIFSKGFKSPSILRMTEWLRSKLSERFHSIRKEPQTSACGHQFRMGKFRGINNIGVEVFIQDCNKLRFRAYIILLHECSITFFLRQLIKF